MTLSGQVALVTGAASGIGRAIATALVAEGAQVVIADLDDMRAQQVAADLGQGKARACRVDITDSQQAEAAIVALTSVLAMELGPHGINVNCVGPGLTDTPLMRRSSTDTYRENFLKQVPLGRMAQPADIADVVAFLCSPAARYVSGQTLFVDGGYLAGKYTSHG